MSIKYDTTKAKQYSVDHTISEVGRRKSLITCPFCYGPFYAYHWSLAGSGKKCPDCGALHTWMGAKAIPVIKGS